MTSQYSKLIKKHYLQQIPEVDFEQEKLNLMNKIHGNDINKKSNLRVKYALAVLVSLLILISVPTLAIISSDDFSFVDGKIVYDESNDHMDEDVFTSYHDLSQKLLAELDEGYYIEVDNLSKLKKYEVLADDIENVPAYNNEFFSSIDMPSGYELEKITYQYDLSLTPIETYKKEIGDQTYKIKVYPESESISTMSYIYHNGSDRMRIELTAFSHIIYKSVTHLEPSVMTYKQWEIMKTKIETGFNYVLTTDIISPLSVSSQTKYYTLVIETSSEKGDKLVKALLDSMDFSLIE